MKPKKARPAKPAKPLDLKALMSDEAWTLTSLLLHADYYDFGQIVRKVIETWPRGEEAGLVKQLAIATDGSPFDIIEAKLAATVALTRAGVKLDADEMCSPVTDRRSVSDCKISGLVTENRA